MVAGRATILGEGMQNGGAVHNYLQKLDKIFMLLTFQSYLTTIKNVLLTTVTM